MKQFGKIFKFEIKNYLANKTFIGVTVFLVAVIAIVMFFPRITETFESDGNTPPPSGDLPIMLVADENNANLNLDEAFSSAFSDYNVLLVDYDLDMIKNKISSGEAQCAIVTKGVTSFTYYVNNLSMYDVNTAVATQVMQELYRLNAMINSGISPDTAGDILNFSVESKTEALGVDQMENYWYTYIMIMALYMVIMLYGQMVATNVATEKSSRAMELLITSVKPTSMMFGKVLASCLAGLTQLVLIFGSAYTFFNINKAYWNGNEIINAIFDMPLGLLVYMLIFFVLGFLIYAFLYGAIGSTASKLEDINTAVMPVTFVFIFSFMVVMFALSENNVDTFLMKACSFIPLTSPMAMFTRIAMSTVPIWEIILSVVILVASVIGIGFLCAKIYRMGVLLYGNRPKLTTVIKMVFKNK